MINDSFIRFCVIAVFAFIVFYLGTAFYHLFTDRGHGDKVVRALTFRIAISIALFIILIVLHQTGLISGN